MVLLESRKNLPAETTDKHGSDSTHSTLFVLGIREKTYASNHLGAQAKKRDPYSKLNFAVSYAVSPVKMGKWYSNVRLVFIGHSTS
ncbi:hypothetical protein C2W64_02757 [Brevibacillus laterosporus]|nr:hypothetical protein C2W64_02757 [Brevibacillus laterosporus]